jgi:hypothetical protein
MKRRRTLPATLTPVVALRQVHVMGERLQKLAEARLRGRRPESAFKTLSHAPAAS